MGTCPACGAPVDFARIQDSSQTVALEIGTDGPTDAARYRVTRLRPLLVLPVRTDAPGQFRVDHEFDCAGANAGRR